MWLRDLLGGFGQGGGVSRQSCYPSDLTDDEWALVEPLLPPAGCGGRPEKHPRRQIVDAVLYVVRTGCAWRQSCRNARADIGQKGLLSPLGSGGAVSDAVVAFRTDVGAKG